ncbi:MAG: ribulose-phosphate 3-epimerase [Anaerolineales bacterium]
MASKPLIAPSILSADFSRLGEQIAEAEQHGADWIHIDVMDGHFVPPITMGQMVTETCRKITDLPLEVHLMVNAPDKMLQSFADAGADHIHVHFEASPDIKESLEAIHSLGCKAGVAINPETPARTLQPALAHADLILVMSVHPGYAGQEFIHEVLPKVSDLRKMLTETKSEAIIEMDGGIDHETLPLGVTAGADAFVAASAVFKHPEGIAAGMQSLRSASLEAQQR